MNKITLFFVLLFTQSIFAQFSPNDVKYIVGSGTKTAYLVVDFNDELSSNSYVWGYRFNESDLTMEDLINAIANDDSSFNPVIASGYLYQLSYNQHSSSTDDDWSTWSGTNFNNMSMNLGINTDLLIDGKWYGLSYGFLEELDLEPTYPRSPISAYSSQWFNASQITNWIGTGTNQSLVVVDFGTDTNNIANSFVYGIKYNESITALQALQLIQDQTSYFNFTSVENQIATINLGSLSNEATAENSWNIYKGTNLSDWLEKENLSQVILSNNQWFGLGFNSSRRPFIPREATETLLSNHKNEKINFTIYPNPTSDYLNIDGENQIQEVTIFNLQGKQILKTNDKTINVSSLYSGMYLLQIKTATGLDVVKFIKK